MVEGWRSRYMAPIYALIFSFLLVFVLGAALNRSVGLVELVVDGADSAALSAVTAEVRAGETTSSGRQFPFEVPEGSFDVCVVLPSGWVAANPQKARQEGERTCWRDLRPGEGGVDLHVTEQAPPDPEPEPTTGPKPNPLHDPCLGWCSD